MARHLFIVNPAAGKKDRSARIRKAVERLLLPEPYAIHITRYPGDAAEVAREFAARATAEEPLRVYACGGDGTLSEVVGGVYLAGTPYCAVGVVPVGSGNDFVKSLAPVPEREFRSIAEMVRGETMQVDLIRVTDDDGTDRVAVNVVSAGFDAAVAKGMNKYRGKPLVSGGAAYKLSVLHCLATALRHRFTLVVDGAVVGEERGDALFVVCANGRYYGGGFLASPMSVLDDGLLDFLRIDSVSRSKLLRLAGVFRRGRHLETRPDLVQHARCKWMQICSTAAIDTNLDGELLALRNPRMEVLPAALQTILPHAVREPTAPA